MAYATLEKQKASTQEKSRQPRAASQAHRNPQSPLTNHYRNIGNRAAQREVPQEGKTATQTDYRRTEEPYYILDKTDQFYRQKEQRGKINHYGSEIIQCVTQVTYGADAVTMGRTKLLSTVSHTRVGGVHDFARNQVRSTARFANPPNQSHCHHSMSYDEIKIRIMNHLDVNAASLGQARDLLAGWYNTINAGPGFPLPVPAASITVITNLGGQGTENRQDIQTAFDWLIRGIADYSENLFYSPAERAATGAVVGGTRMEPDDDPIGGLPVGWIPQFMLTANLEQGRVRAARTLLDNTLP